MIFQGTYLRVIDNCGARKALCLKVLKKNQRSRAYIGDKIIVVVKKAMANKKIKKHTIQTALVVRDSFSYRRFDGSYLKFADPCCVILKKDGTPVGKKVSGPLPIELRKLGHIRLISISKIAI
jgi:large subunit ribosomal protein L14